MFDNGPVVQMQMVEWGRNETKRSYFAQEKLQEELLNPVRYCQRLVAFKIFGYVMSCEL